MINSQSASIVESLSPLFLFRYICSIVFIEHSLFIDIATYNDRENSWKNQVDLFHLKLCIIRIKINQKPYSYIYIYIYI